MTSSNTVLLPHRQASTQIVEIEYDVIDPDALDSLLQNNAVNVFFDYARYSIEISENIEIAIHPKSTT
mgnify:CR=1 FL=1